MRLSQRFSYFFLCILVYISLSLIEFFLLDDFASIITSTVIGKIIIYVVVVIIFNPFFTYQIMNLIPYKVKGLRTDRGVKESYQNRNFR